MARYDLAVVGAGITLGGPVAQSNGSAVALLVPGHLALAFVVRKALHQGSFA